MKRLVLLLFGGILALASVTPFTPVAAAGGGAGPMTAFAVLEPLNGSGVTGVASMLLQGNVLTVTVYAVDLEPNRAHPQHIHGFLTDQNAVCPTVAADDNGDGLVDLMEGLPAYGPVQLPFEPFPMASAAGVVAFSQTYTLTNEQLAAIMPLERMAVVLHGMTVGREYMATLPVACGSIFVPPVEAP